MDKLLCILVVSWCLCCNKNNCRLSREFSPPLGRSFQTFRVKEYPLDSNRSKQTISTDIQTFKHLDDLACIYGLKGWNDSNARCGGIVKVSLKKAIQSKEKMLEVYSLVNEGLYFMWCKWASVGCAVLNVHAKFKCLYPLYTYITHLFWLKKIL